MNFNINNRYPDLSNLKGFYYENYSRIYHLLKALCQVFKFYKYQKFWLINLINL